MESVCCGPGPWGSVLLALGVSAVALGSGGLGHVVPLKEADYRQKGILLTS